MTDLAAVARQQLQDRQAACLTINNQRLLMALMPVFGEQTKELLLVYEGGGSMVYAGDRPLNKFRLIQKGFPFGVAELVSDLVNAIVRTESIKSIEGDNHE